MNRLSHGFRRTASVSKRDLLLFDNVSVMGLEGQLSSIHEISPGDAADLEYLINVGYLKGASDTVWDLALDFLTNFHSIYGDIPVTNEFVSRTLSLASACRHPASHKGEMIAVRPPVAELIGARFLNAVAEGSTVPVMDEPVPPAGSELLRHLHYFVNGGGRPAVELPPRTSGIVDLVLKRLPIPDESVSIEQVFDFISDPDTKLRLAALRLWMSRFVVGGASLEQAALELDEMLHNFSQHMRAHCMKEQTGVLRSIISIPFEVIEEVAHARPKKALDAMFELKARKASKFEAELNAPGHEIAYIDQAKRRFGSSYP